MNARALICLPALALSGCGAQAASHSACYVLVWNAVVTCSPEPDPASAQGIRYHITVDAAPDATQSVPDGARAPPGARVPASRR